MKYHSYMIFEKYQEEKNILDDLLATLKASYADHFIGLYLYGSLATGDFSSGQSDIDLLIVIKTEINEESLTIAKNLHKKFNVQHMGWVKRIDVAYMNIEDLKVIKSKPYTTIVSNGSGGVEIVAAPEYYLIDWFKVQSHSINLFGPPVSTLMPTISKDEFKSVVRNYMQTLDNGANDAKNRGAQAYLVLTACRSLYAYLHGEHTSKKDGAT